MPKARMAELVLDYTLYPRTAINSVHVGDLLHALRAGQTLPPIIADRKSKRVVDGFHRLTAARRVWGNDAEIAVEWRDYANDGALYLEAVAFNAHHGQKLSHYDQVRAILRAQELAVEPAQIAAALSLTTARVDELILTRTAIGADAEAVPLRHTVQHLAGTHLSGRRQEGARVSAGMSPLFYLRQVINLLEGDLLDLDDERITARLGQLRDLLARVELPALSPA